MELGTKPWLDAVRDEINRSEAFANYGRQWKHPLGVKFVGDDSTPTRCVVLELEAGRCHDARECDQGEYDELEFALSAPYQRWRKILSHELDLMRCIVLNRVELRGDRFSALRFLPAAKALLDACASVSEPTTAP